MDEPSFNLWAEPWITVEKVDGQLEAHGIQKVLTHAHEYHTIYDPSPLVFVGIHRLLTAILQDIFDPRHEKEIANLWKEGQFHPDQINAFGEQYAHRFDLFSETEPFMQSADLPLRWQKGDKPGPKSVVTLFPEMPSGTGVTHYQHAEEQSSILSPACAARGLIMLSAFASSGGAGIKPSINGVPPLYILPGGETLFESLVASLLVPPYQPVIRDQKNDLAWWKRENVVHLKEECERVGYLHSLTFPARRVRLHPISTTQPCTDTGKPSQWSVKTMIFQMGESRPKEAPFWFDPFAAYRLPRKDSKSEKKETPTPIRPVEGRVLWREFANLFLISKESKVQQPTVLEQIGRIIDDYQVVSDEVPYPFRCIGMRTDMKAKVFEWIDEGFSIPPTLIRDPMGGIVVQGAIDFSMVGEKSIKQIFTKHFGKSGKAERFQQTKQIMVEKFWQELTPHFRHFVLSVADETKREQAQATWLDGVVDTGLSVFQQATSTLGDSAATLRQRVQGETDCRIKLFSERKKWKGASL